MSIGQLLSLLLEKKRWLYILYFVFIAVCSSDILTDARLELDLAHNLFMDWTTDESRKLTEISYLCINKLLHYDL